MDRSQRNPALLALIAAFLWGMWWIPIRHLNAIGLEGAWAGISINTATALVLLAIILFRKKRTKLSIKSISGALFIGIAVTTYAAALSFTVVAHAVLLFYLCPAWSTIIECTCLKRRWSWYSILAVGFSLTGMVLIFGNSILTADLGMGDLLALSSGVCWSIGSALLFTGPRIPILYSAFVCMAGSALIGLFAVAIWKNTLGMMPTTPVFVAALPIIIASASIYFVPMIVITIYSAGLLAPALMSFLLSFEILSGIGSSVIMLDEPFGLTEILGTFCVILGAVIEIFIPKGRQYVNDS